MYIEVTKCFQYRASHVRREKERSGAEGSERALTFQVDSGSLENLRKFQRQVKATPPSLLLVEASNYHPISHKQKSDPRDLMRSGFVRCTRGLFEGTISYR
jgi:hypothetical protein